MINYKSMIKYIKIIMVEINSQKIKSTKFINNDYVKKLKI